jgi:hypothetical protein
MPPLQGSHGGWPSTQGFHLPVGRRSPWAIPCQPFRPEDVLPDVAGLACDSVVLAPAAGRAPNNQRRSARKIASVG